MIITVLTFGIAREILGGSQVTLATEPGINTEGLKNELRRQYPALERLTSFAIAVNGNYASIDAIILPGDEVAIIPPVSGG